MLAIFEEASDRFAGRRVRIRSGALVGQDFGFLPWEDTGEVFTVAGRVRGSRNVFCHAPGYGEAGAYGSGELCVPAADLLTEDGAPLVPPVDRTGQEHYAAIQEAVAEANRIREGGR